MKCRASACRLHSERKMQSLKSIYCILARLIVDCWQKRESQHASALSVGRAVETHGSPSALRGDDDDEELGPMPPTCSCSRSLPHDDGHAPSARPTCQKRFKTGSRSQRQLGRVSARDPARVQAGRQSARPTRPRPQLHRNAGAHHVQRGHTSALYISLPLSPH